MISDNIINNIILKKYITKHYIIYKIDSIYPISKKLSARVEYTLFDIQLQEEISLFTIDNYLCKIFDVNSMDVKIALNELVKEKIDKLLKHQLNIF